MLIMQIKYKSLVPEMAQQIAAFATTVPRTQWQRRELTLPIVICTHVRRHVSSSPVTYKHSKYMSEKEINLDTCFDF